MKRIISIILCLVIFCSSIVSVSALENQTSSITVNATVPQVKCTITEGDGKYTVYMNGKEVDGTSVDIDRNVPFTIQIEAGSNQEILYSELNGKIIYSYDGRNYTLNLTEDENTVTVYVKDVKGIVAVVNKIVTAVKNFFSKLFGR